MLILDSPTKTIEVILAGAVATNQLPVVAAFVDVGAAPDVYTPGSNDTQSNGANAVTIVPAPGANLQRQVKLLTVFNADTAAAAATIRYNNHGTLRPIVKVTLAVGSTLVYTDGDGWRAITAAGEILTVSGLILSSGILFSTTQRVAGRNAAGAGAGEEVTLSQLLDWIGAAAQGDILYRGTLTWARLAAGTLGQALKTNGAGANPAWATYGFWLAWSPDINLGAGATKYVNWGAFDAASEPNVSIPAPYAMTFKNMRAFTGGSPGAGQSYTITLRKNGADTALAVTISDGGTSGSDLADTVAFAAGDTISVKCVASAGANNTGGINVTFEIYPT